MQIEVSPYRWRSLCRAAHQLNRLENIQNKLIDDPGRFEDPTKLGQRARISDLIHFWRFRVTMRAVAFVESTKRLEPPATEDWIRDRILEAQS